MLKRILKHPLTAVLVFALLVRAAMIMYGLPLWLYNDEPPFVLGALKMMQLKTLIPALHPDAFASILYYPVYICYIYLPFLVAQLGISWIGFSGSFTEFQQVIGSDPSAFFIMARVVTIAMSLASIILIYKTTLFITKERTASVLAAFLASTSVLHIILSVSGRQWMPVLFFYALAAYFIHKPGWTIRRRVILAAAVTGIGTGISVVVILFSFYILLWYLLGERARFKSIFTGPHMYTAALIIAALAVIPILLHPSSLGFVGDTTIQGAKTVWGFLVSPITFPWVLAATEPVLVLLFLFGAWRGIRRREAFLSASVLFLIFYSLVFYVFFRDEHRFLAPYIVFLSIGAGYGIKELCAELSKKQATIMLCIIILLTGIVAVRLSALGSRNDSRILMRNWVMEHITPGEKILVFANLTRLPNTPEGIVEQELLDSASLRTVDTAERTMTAKLRKDPAYHALNLYTVNNDLFYETLETYARKNGYRYLMTSTVDFRNKPEQFAEVRKIAEKGTLLVQFGDEHPDFSLAKSELGPTILPLFTINGFGPAMELYELATTTTP